MNYIVDLKLARLVERDADTNDQLARLAANRSLELDEERLLGTAAAERPSSEQRAEERTNVSHELLLEISVPLGAQGPACMLLERLQDVS